MSDLSERLLSESALKGSRVDVNPVNISQTSKAQAEQAPVEVNTHAVLDFYFDELKDSVKKAFSCTNSKLPFKCAIIKLSTRHSILVGAHFKTDQFDKSPKEFNTNEGTASCICFNAKEDLIFIGTSKGKIISYSFPDMVKGKIVYNVGDSDVRFDFSERGYLYAVCKDSIQFKMITVKTAKVHVIGRCSKVDYVRANHNHKYVAICSNEIVKVYSIERKWQEFILNLKKLEEEEDEGDHAPRTCEIEFTKFRSILGVSYMNYIQLWSIKSWTLICTLQLTTETDISSFKFNNDDEWIVAVGTDHSINIWSLESVLDSKSPKPRDLLTKLLAYQAARIISFTT